MDSKSYHHAELSPAHNAILALVRPGSSVLEVGCATGYMTRALKEQLGCRVTAVEVDAAQAAEAEPHAERLLVADIGEASTWNELAGPGFDHVIFADVLEHLADPWEALRRARSALAEGGTVLASIPNVAYYRVRLQLLAGRFDYSEYGILDGSHLRFFTVGSAAALVASSGFRIEKLVRIYRGRRDSLPGSIFPNAFTYQFVMRAAPTGRASV